MNVNVKADKIQRKNVSHFRRNSHKYPELLDNTPLNLTEAGKVSLAKYPDDALRHAFSELKRSSPKDDPVMWVHKVCRSWCKDEGVWPDSVWVEQQFEYHDWDASTLLLDPSQPYKTNPKPAQQAAKEKHFRKLEPEEIEPLKKKYKDSVNQVSHAQETYEQEPTQINKNWLRSHERFRDEIRDLLRYNEIDYEVQPFTRKDTLDDAMINIQKVRNSPASQILTKLYESFGKDTVEIERGILERAEKIDKDKRGSIHPLLR